MEKSNTQNAPPKSPLIDIGVLSTASFVFNISWETVPGVGYTIEKSNDLLSWTSIPNLASTGGEATSHFQTFHIFTRLRSTLLLGWGDAAALDAKSP